MERESSEAITRMISPTRSRNISLNNVGSVRTNMAK